MYNQGYLNTSLLPAAAHHTHCHNPLSGCTAESCSPNFATLPTAAILATAATLTAAATLTSIPSVSWILSPPCAPHTPPHTSQLTLLMLAPPNAPSHSSSPSLPSS